MSRINSSYQYNYSPAAELKRVRREARKNVAYILVTLAAFAAIGIMFGIAA